MNHALFYYYTATGNTQRALGIIAAALQKSGWTCELAEMAGSMPAQPSANAELLIVGFPALGFSAPSTVIKTLRRLPRVSGARAVVLCLVGSEPGKKGIVRGWAGVATHVAMAILRKKGYIPAGTAEISYPANWTQFQGAVGHGELESMIRAGDAEAAAAGESIALHTPVWVRRSIAAHTIARFTGFMFRNFARRVLARLFVADASCNGCGLCARSCPSASILMIRQKPVWKNSCSACNRCINICPRRSIQTSIARVVLVSGTNLAALVAAWPISAMLVKAAVPETAGLWGDSAAAVITGAGALGFYILLTLFQLGPMDRLLQILERTPGLRKPFAAAFSAKFARYTAPDFEPRAFSTRSRKIPSPPASS